MKINARNLILLALATAAHGRINNPNKQQKRPNQHLNANVKARKLTSHQKKLLLQKLQKYRHDPKSRKLIFGSIGNWFDGAIDDIGDAFDDAGDWFDGAIDDVGDAFDDAGDWFDGAIDDVGDAFGDAGDWFDGAIDDVGDAFDDAGDWFDGAFEDIGDAFGDVGDWFDGAVDDVGDAFGDAGEWLGDAADDAGDWFTGAAEDVGDWVVGAAEDTGDWVVGAAEDTGDWFADAAVDVGLFYIAMGNAMFGEASGEAICAKETGHIWNDATTSGLADAMVESIKRCRRTFDAEGRAHYHCPNTTSNTNFNNICSAVGGRPVYSRFTFNCGGKQNEVINFPGCVHQTCNKAAEIKQIQSKMFSIFKEKNAFTCERTCAEKSGGIWKEASLSGLDIAFVDAIKKCRRTLDTEGRVQYICPDSNSNFNYSCRRVGGKPVYNHFAICDGTENHVMNLPGCVSHTCNDAAENKEIQRLIFDQLKDDAFKCEPTCVEQFSDLWAKPALSNAYGDAMSSCEMVRVGNNHLEYRCPQNVGFESACSAAGGSVHNHNFAVGCGGDKQIDAVNVPDCVGTVCLAGDIDAIGSKRQDYFVEKLPASMQCSAIP